MKTKWTKFITGALGFVALLFTANTAFASEADLIIPTLDVTFDFFGHIVPGTTLLWIGLVVCLLGMLFGLTEFIKIKKLPVFGAMSDVSELIYETCKTYLVQQGKLLLIHGVQDQTVVMQHSIQFLKKCIDINKQVDFFVYPTHEHNVRGNDRLHLMEKISNYFLENL